MARQASDPVLAQDAEAATGPRAHAHNGPLFSRVVHVHLAERPGYRFPLVLLDGLPAFVLNHWIFHMMMTGVERSVRDERIRAIRHLYDLYKAEAAAESPPDPDGKKLALRYLTYKSSGTANAPGLVGALQWPKATYKTFQRYLAALVEFDKWQSAYHDAPRLNVTETRCLTAWEEYSQFQAREKWDPLLHLYPSRSHKKHANSINQIKHHRRLQSVPVNAPKAFPLNAFVELVERSTCPRDKMLWLELFGFGQRGSEPLHRFMEDIYGIGEEGAALIRLDDPEQGVWRYRLPTGKVVPSTRERYLDTQWRNDDLREVDMRLVGLMPRTRYGSNSGMGVGFKGMTFAFDEAPNVWGHTGVWLDPRLGIYFLKCFRRYVREHFDGKPPRWPYHPWLYIQLDRKDFGMPMTRPALYKAWRRAVDRVGLGSRGYGDHALRHLAGYYAANVLKKSVDDTRDLLRHASSESTRTYFRVQSAVARREILSASSGRDPAEAASRLGQATPLQKLVLPPHWTSD